ncbi:MAG TPA: hypothetical protein VHZ74_01260 [Bryobacteraceae bacterium]|nr:hypothetical protein [Bryobacteraceae bacterium]
MRHNGWILRLALAAGALSFASARSTPPDAGHDSNQAPKAKTKDKVTTNDTALKPSESGKAKTKKGKARPAPVSPPNPPVADPHEDPSSPVNQPKTPAGAPAPK